MTLLALCCSAKINVASPLTINLKPWQTMTKTNKKCKKKKKTLTTIKRRNAQTKEEKEKKV